MKETLHARFLVDSAIWLAAATGFLFVAGYLEQDAYYARLGIPIAELDYPTSFFMTRSLGSVLLPAVLFLLSFALNSSRLAKVSTVSSEKAAPPSEEEQKTAVTPAAAALVISLLWAGTKLAGLGDSTFDFVPGSVSMTLLDLVLYCVITLSAYALIKIHQTEKMHQWDFLRLVFGREAGAQPLMGVLAVLFLVLAAMFVGSDRGNDAAWGCHALPGIHFSPAPSAIANGTEYWLIAHRGGNYYMRSTAEHPYSLNYTIVREDQADSAQVYRIPAWNDCQT